MFISYKELSATCVALNARRGAARSVPPVRTNAKPRGLFRWTALLHSSKGAAGDSTSNESNRTDTTDRDWFPGHYPSSFLFVLLFYFTERGYHTGILMTTRHLNVSRSNRTATAGAESIVITSSEQGWYPIEMERNNNTNIGNNNNKRRQTNRAADIRREHATGASDVGNFYLEYNRLHRSTKGGAIVFR